LLVWIGVQCQSVAIGWEMWRRTNDEWSLGLVALMQAIPAIGLALPAGYLADRFDRRRLIIAAMGSTTVTSMILAYLSARQGSINLMYTTLFLDATLITMARPARGAILATILPRHDFPNGVTWNVSMFQAALFIGPALGGFVVAWKSTAAYVICACCTLICMLFMTQLRTPYASTAPRREPASWNALMAGVRFLSRSRLLLAAISLDMFAVLLGGATYLMPIFAGKDYLNVGAEGLGWLNAAPAAGAILMGFALAHLPPMKKAGRNLLWSVVGFGLATIVFGLSRNFILSLAMLFLVGAFDAVSVVVRHTLAQLLTPDEMRGRLNAVNSVFISTSNQIGGVESSAVAKAFGPVVSVVAGGIGTIIVVAIIAIRSKGLREFGALHDAKPEEEK